MSVDWCESKLLRSDAMVPLAADQGLPEANHNLGLLYYSGYGADVNEREAFLRFRAAAEKELPESLYMLGLMVSFWSSDHTKPRDCETIV